MSDCKLCNEMWIRLGNIWAGSPVAECCDIRAGLRGLGELGWSWAHLHLVKIWAAGAGAVKNCTSNLA